MSIKGAITKSLALILWFCFLSPAPGRAQQTTGQADEIRIATDSPVRTLSGSEKKELKRKLKASNERNIKTVETDNAPLAISETRVRGVKIEGDASSGSPPPINDYAMQVSVTLVNRESRPITGLGVEFANAQSNSVFYVYRHPVDIGVNKKYRLDIGFIAVTGDPSALAIRLVGVRFADETVWGSFPLVPRNAPLRLLPVPSASQATPRSAGESVVAPVDSKPKLLNNPFPRYTEEARLNRVMGTASMRVLIGADGSVKQVKVLRALPDGLTEEAIRAAYSLKFAPAKRNDQTVAFWQNVEIEFNLK